VTREEAISRAAEDAAKFVAGLRPYELMNGSCVNWAKLKEQGFASLADWFKRHWAEHPGSFPTATVEAYMRDETPLLKIAAEAVP
jgi:hypothetical protein